jgi:hypothetical protein
MEMGKMSRKTLKPKSTAKVKTVEERELIAKELEQKIRDLGISEEFESIAEFFKILREYSKPVIKSGFSGQIPFVEGNRTIEYVLPLNKLTAPYVNLKC